MKKCECCGSMEFRAKKAIRVCAYCRTEQEGQVADSVNIVNRFCLNQVQLQAERQVRWDMSRAINQHLISL